MIKAFFEADLFYNTGYGMTELSAPQAALCAIDRHVGGTHHAIGSAQQIADRLEKCVNDKGGRVIYRSPVEEIIVEGTNATGVRLADGRPVKADAVIANVSVRDLFERMLPDGNLQPTDSRPYRRDGTLTGCDGVVPRCTGGRGSGRLQPEHDTGRMTRSASRNVLSQSACPRCLIPTFPRRASTP